MTTAIPVQSSTNWANKPLLRRSLSYSRLYPQFEYMTFIYSQPFIHHFTGLFGTNAVGLSAQLSTAPVSQRSWVQTQYGPEFFEQARQLELFRVFVLECAYQIMSFQYSLWYFRGIWEEAMFAWLEFSQVTRPTCRGKNDFLKVTASWKCTWL